MRVLSLTLATLATSAVAIVPATACSWMKTAEKENMTVVDVPTVEKGDVAIATNDLSDEAIKNMTVKPLPKETAAE